MPPSAMRDPSPPQVVARKRAVIGQQEALYTLIEGAPPACHSLTHNGIRETREDLLDTMGVGIPNYYKRINNPQM